MIEYNTISGNSGAGIGALESPRVTVQKNTIAGGYTCIELRNLDRGSADLRIHDVIDPAQYLYERRRWDPTKYWELDRI